MEYLIVLAQALGISVAITLGAFALMLPLIRMLDAWDAEDVDDAYSNEDEEEEL